MCDVASPGAQNRIRPRDRQHRESRADDFVKKLSQSPPEATETASRRRVHRANGSGHVGSLAQMGRVENYTVEQVQLAQSPHTFETGSVRHPECCHRSCLTFKPSQGPSTAQARAHKPRREKSGPASVGRTDRCSTDSSRMRITSCEPIGDIGLTLACNAQNGSLK
jgi:hypothetical protein